MILPNTFRINSELYHTDQVLKCLFITFNLKKQKAEITVLYFGILYFIVLLSMFVANNVHFCGYKTCTVILAMQLICKCSEKYFYLYYFAIFENRLIN